MDSSDDDLDQPMYSRTSSTLPEMDWDALFQSNLRISEEDSGTPLLPGLGLSDVDEHLTPSSLDLPWNFLSPSSHQFRQIIIISDGRSARSAKQGGLGKAHLTAQCFLAIDGAFHPRGTPRLLRSLVVIHETNLR